MFAINVYTMPSLTTHAACDKWYCASKLPRGKAWQENERPLDGNRAHHKRIVKNNDGSYSLYLYQCEHLRYFANGDVAVRLYPSLSSRRFVERMLPFGTSLNIVTSTALVWVCTEEGDQWIHVEGVLHLSPTTTPGVWLVRSGEGERRREFVCRRTAYEVRRKLKPFLDYAEAHNKIDPGTPMRPAYAVPYFDNIEDMDVWPHVVRAALYRQPFIELAYDHFGARRAVAIPSNTPPRRGRSSWCT